VRAIKTCSLHVLDAEKIASGPGAVVKDCVIHIMPASGARIREANDSLFEHVAWLYAVCRGHVFRDDTERDGFFNRSTSILIAEAIFALELP
jgi:hypothetical protein